VAYRQRHCHPKARARGPERETEKAPTRRTGTLVSPACFARDCESDTTAADHVVLPAGDYCQGFTAVITFTDFNQYIIRSTTAPDGTVTLQIAGRARATVTNQETGESVSYNIQRTGHACLQSGWLIQRRPRGAEPAAGELFPRSADAQLHDGSRDV
jgi:hypothetical protein